MMEQNDGDCPVLKLLSGFHKDAYHDQLHCLDLFLNSILN